MLNTSDVVRYIDKIGVLTGMSPYTLHELLYRWMLLTASSGEDNINKVIIGISHKLISDSTRPMVADTSTHRSGLRQVANGNKQHVGGNCNQWKTKKWDVGVTITNERGVAAGHVGVVDYIIFWVLAKVSCLLALQTPEELFVCANSLRLHFCSTQVSSSRIKI